MDTSNRDNTMIDGVRGAVGPVPASAVEKSQDAVTVALDGMVERPAGATTDVPGDGESIAE